MALQVTSLLADLELLSRLESADMHHHMKERQHCFALLKHYTQVRHLLWIGQIGMNQWEKFEQFGCDFIYISIL